MNEQAQTIDSYAATAKAALEKAVAVELLIGRDASPPRCSIRCVMADGSRELITVVGFELSVLAGESPKGTMKVIHCDYTVTEWSAPFRPGGAPDVAWAAPGPKTVGLVYV